MKPQIFICAVMDNSINIGIVIPTYNEAGNITGLINTILNAAAGRKVVVVDDNSPDGTANIVRRNFRDNSAVILIRRPIKMGRGSAVVEGFKYLLSSGGGYDYIFEMDGDFSHNPSDIDKFLAKIAGYDMLVGSRFLPGSKRAGCSRGRIIFSRISIFYARMLLGIPVTDYNSGYRCYKYRVLKDFDFRLIQERGYFVMTEMAYRIFLKGCRIGELPISFVNRREGTSKFRFQEIVSALTGINRLKFKKSSIMDSPAKSFR